MEGAFCGFDKEGTGAVIVGIVAFFIQQRRQIAELAVKHRLPSISASGEYADAGGLLGYGQTCFKTRCHRRHDSRASHWAGVSRQENAAF